ncbi:ABC transporter permease [Celeribacter sp.]|uniref:ABC transporter permease n=1 Tax=Celeribacter sp. TaxID=1890673 RepID=UPI003A958624
MTALLRIVFVVGFVGAWALASNNAEWSFIPHPLETLSALKKLALSGELSMALGQSLSIFASGLGLAALVGIPFGAVMGMVPPIGRMLDVFVYALAATPRVAFIPLIIVLLGLGVEAKSFVVFLGAVMPIVINTYAGVQNADDELIEMARSTGLGRLELFWHVVLPGAVPFLVTGIRLGATIGLINTIVAELYMAVNGLGGLLALYGNTFRMAEYFAVVFVLAFIGGLVNEGLRLAERRVLSWRRTVER